MALPDEVDRMRREAALRIVALGKQGPVGVSAVEEVLRGYDTAVEAWLSNEDWDDPNNRRDRALNG